MENLTNLIQLYVQYGLEPAAAIDKAREDVYKEKARAREEKAREDENRHIEEMAKIAREDVEAREEKAREDAKAKEDNRHIEEMAKIALEMAKINGTHRAFINLYCINIYLLVTCHTDTNLRRTGTCTHKCYLFSCIFLCYPLRLTYPFYFEN